MKFVIIGYGFVGRAIDGVLSEKHKTVLVDPKLVTYDERAEDEPDLFYQVSDLASRREVDGFVICVPTPQDEYGRCDDELVRRYVFEIQNVYPAAHILIKSTTAIDTLMSFTGNVTFSPEFLRGSISADPSLEFKRSSFMIFGGPDGRWWHDVFSDVMEYTEVRFLDIGTAGFLKYAENSFLATKVMWFNELKALFTVSVGENYDAMIEALALDKRIGFSHTAVPGPDGKYGFGGHCLPKDSSEFVEFAKIYHRKLELLELAIELNKQYRN
jgi:UDPglucose 6-dehydrogenase